MWKGKKKKKSCEYLEMCVSGWLSEQAHIYIAVQKREEKKPEIPEYFQTGLNILPLHCFFTASRVNEWFALWVGGSAFKRENVLNSYLYRRLKD